MNSTPDITELARASLVDIAPTSAVGEVVDVIDEPAAPGVQSVRFASLLPGYPDWLWTVSITSVDGADPTVLEAELLPGDGALLAPDWVPWSVRLEEYNAAQALGDDESESDDDADDDDADDSDDDDASDEHDDFADAFDGIDIDSLAADDETDDGADADDDVEDDSEEAAPADAEDAAP